MGQTKPLSLNLNCRLRFRVDACSAHTADPQHRYHALYHLTMDPPVGPPPAAARVWIVRHGQRADEVSFAELAEREEEIEAATGLRPRDGDAPLTAEGTRQAAAAGALLRALAEEAGIRFTGGVYTSPFRRTAQTAAPIAAALGLPLIPCLGLGSCAAYVKKRGLSRLYRDGYFLQSEQLATLCPGGDWRPLSLPPSPSSSLSSSSSSSSSSSRSSSCAAGGGGGSTVAAAAAAGGGGGGEGATSAATGDEGAAAGGGAAAAAAVAAVTGEAGKAGEAGEAGAAGAVDESFQQACERLAVPGEDVIVVTHREGIYDLLEHGAGELWRWGTPPYCGIVQAVFDSERV